jgi:DNA invertase Pin-like site-specific DNA recombinase
MGKDSGTASRRQSVGNTAAFYLRRSAIHERGEDTSIDYQREACERIAAQHGLEVVGEFNEGSGRSASHFKENDRPEYDRALEGLGSSYTVLISYAVDRLTRRGMQAVGFPLDKASAGGGRIINQGTPMV